MCKDRESSPNRHEARERSTAQPARGYLVVNTNKQRNILLPRSLPAADDGSIKGHQANRFRASEQIEAAGRTVSGGPSDVRNTPGRE
ncbi:hypothetical protein EVAR_86492_1 [Eumeta japonica]|uniref:Uncharacterized protein n=1 Tax=Eumeta variegata TaxID=151549 RepID=A0A4C1VMK7_EUMVA|nr:hypothetical protein EVAR_86492_1 [Eumeta japonica]